MPDSITIIDGTSESISIIDPSAESIYISDPIGPPGPPGSGTGGGGGAMSISAGASSDTLASLVFANQNGISFGLGGSTITASHNGLTNSNAFLGSGASSSFRHVSDNSQLQFTSANSNFLGTAATSAFLPTGSSSNFLGTGATQSFRHTSADTQLQFTSANSNFLGSGATQSFRHTSADSQLRFTSADSQLRFTSQDSQLQFTSANSLFTGSFLGTAATQSFRHTSADSQLLSTSQSSLFRHTSADTQLQFTSANTNFLGTAATQSFRFTSQNSQLRFTSQDSQLRFTSNAIGAVGISTAGNSAGTTGSEIGTYWFQGGNNITLSQITSNNQSHTLIVSGPATVAQTNQTLGLYAVSNTTQSTSGTVDARTLSFQGAGVASVGVSNGSVIVSVPPGGGAAGTNTLGMSNIGNTAGDSAIRSGSAIQLVFAGGNNITLSQSTAGSSATITVSGPNTAAQSVQTQGMVSIQGSTGNISFSNAGGVTFGFNASTITAAAPAQTVESQSFGMSNLGNTSGTTGIASGGQMRFLLAGGNNITLSQSVNGASGTITISAPNAVAQTVESNTLGMSNLGNTSGTTGVASGGQVRFLFAGGNNITLSQSINGASGTITISSPNTAAQSVQPIGTNTIGMSNIGNTAGDTAIRSGTGMQVVFAGGNNITLSQSTAGSNATITISGGAGGGSQSFGMSNLGNTSGTSGIASGSAVQFLFAGGDNVTLSQSLNGASGTVTISAGGGVQSNQTLGMYAGGNTTASSSGTQDARSLTFQGGGNVSVGVTGGSVLIQGGSAAPSPIIISAGGSSGSISSLVFSNSNLVSFGLNGSTITGSVPGTSSLSGSGAISISINGNTISIGGVTSSLSATGAVSISANGDTISIGAPANGLNFSGGNSVGNTFSLSGGTVAFYGGDNITLSLDSANSKVSISAASAAGAPTVPYYEADGIVNMGLITNITNIVTRPIFVPFNLRGNLTNSSLIWMMSRSTNGTNVFTVFAGIYTYANSTSINLLGSTSQQYSGTNTASISGIRYFMLSGWPTAVTAMTPGAYVLGLNFSCGGGAATVSMNYSLFGDATASIPVGFVSPGADQNDTSNTTRGAFNMWGRYTVGSAGLPAAVGQSHILANFSGASAPLAPWFVLRP